VDFEELHRVVEIQEPAAGEENKEEENKINTETRYPHRILLYFDK